MPAESLREPSITDVIRRETLWGFFPSSFGLNGDDSGGAFALLQQEGRGGAWVRVVGAGGALAEGLEAGIGVTSALEGSGALYSFLFPVALLRILEVEACFVVKAAIVLVLGLRTRFRDFLADSQPPAKSLEQQLAAMVPTL